MENWLSISLPYDLYESIVYLLKQKGNLSNFNKRQRLTNSWLDGSSDVLCKKLLPGTLDDSIVSVSWGAT